jgi:hypothetical protein
LGADLIADFITSLGLLPFAPRGRNGKGTESRGEGRNAVVVDGFAPHRFIGNFFVEIVIVVAGHAGFDFDVDDAAAAISRLVQFLLDDGQRGDGGGRTCKVGNFFREAGKRIGQSG